MRNHCVRGELRNEAILRLGGLVVRGCGGGLELGIGGGRGLFGLFDLFGLETLKLLEGVAVVAVGHIDAALEAGELVAGFAEGDGEVDVEDSVGDVGEALLPELGFDAAEAAEEPFGIDEGVDEHALLGGGGMEAVVILVGEGFEAAGGFVLDDVGTGVDAGFESVHRGAGLALGGAGSGGFLRVEAIGCELFLGGHKTGG